MTVTHRLLGDAVTHLQTNASPTLFCDTSVLLDIIRIPVREISPEKCARTLNAVSSVLAQAQSGDLSIIIPPPVYDEWTKHAQRLKEETEGHLKKLQDQYDVHSVVDKLRGGSPQAVKISATETSEFLYTLSENFLSISTHLKQHDDISLLAVKRAASYTAPASKGAIKDCLLYEHTLHIMKNLRQQSFAQPLILLTSNTNDFCENGTPKEPIKTEFLTLNAQLCTTWYWALSELFPGK